jgi:hypothetical protein
MRSGWNLIQFFYKNCAFVFQAIDDKSIMHDFVAHIDRCAILLERQFDDLDRTVNASAKAARCGKKDGQFRLWGELFIHLTGHLGNDKQMAKRFPDVAEQLWSILAGCSGWNSPIKRRASDGSRLHKTGLGPQGKTEMKFVHILCPAAALFFAGCASNGEIDVTSGVGVTATRTGCPTVGVVDGTGDITIFNPANSQDAMMRVKKSIPSRILKCRRRAGIRAARAP